MLPIGVLVVNVGPEIMNKALFTQTELEFFLADNFLTSVVCLVLQEKPKRVCGRVEIRIPYVLICKMV